MTVQEKFKKIIDSPILYIENFMRVVNKLGKLVLFKLNPQQKKLLQDMEKYNIILKSRQLGITTLSCAYSIYLACTNSNTTCLLVSYSIDSATSIFEKLKQLYNDLPSALRVELIANNKKELKFVNGSRIICATCGSKDVARGLTIRFAHLSEVGFMKDTIDRQLLAIEQALTPNGKIILESTANGLNYFSELWNKAERKENLYKPFFFSWIDDKVMFADEYKMFCERYKNQYKKLPTLDELDEKEKVLYNQGASIEQLVWRRLKIANSSETSFTQEFPSNAVEAFNRIYKKGIYTKTDYEIVNDLYTYGNAFEYTYIDGNGVIKSKVIANEDAYPVYDDNFNYVAFVEHWEDFTTGHSNYIVYTPTLVQTYVDNVKTDEYNNLSGLPIHYCMMDKTEYNFFGDSIMNDLMPIMNQVESLLSKLDDAITTLSLNPIGVSEGQRIDESIPKDIVGATINLEDGGDFKWVNAQMDYNNIKLLLDSLVQQLYAVAGVPASVIGQGNISNVSEVSLKLIFSQTDNKAKQTVQVLKEGFYNRFEYFRKLLAIQGTAISDDNYDSLDITFSVNRPVDTESMMNELKTQYDMGAISKQTIIDVSPYTVDTSLEMQRIEKEKGSTSSVTM